MHFSSYYLRMESLPTEMMEYILSFIVDNIKERGGILLVCRNWYRILNTEVIKDIGKYHAIQQRLRHETFDICIINIRQRLFDAIELMNKIIGIDVTNIFYGCDAKNYIHVEYTLCHSKKLRNNPLNLNIETIKRNSEYHAQLLAYNVHLYDINIDAYTRTVVFRT